MNGFRGLLELVAAAVLLLPMLPLAAGEDDEGSTMPVLQSRWDLPIPDLFICETSEFVFRFDMSTLVENYMTKLHLLRGENCDIDIWNNNYLIPTVEYDQAPPDINGASVRQVALVLTPDFSLIGNSPIYTVSDDETTGTLEFCVRLEVYTKDESTRVNWRDAQYLQTTTLQEGVRKLQVQVNNNALSHRHLSNNKLDCSSGYDVVFENWWSLQGGQSVDPVNITMDYEDDDGDFSSVMVGPSGINNLLNIESSAAYNLEAYECDLNNAPVAVEAYNQGDVFRICARPDAEAASDGLFLRQLDSMHYSKTVSNGEPPLVQYAIEGGQPDFFGFSRFDCPVGSPVCWVETLLRAEFFETPGSVTLVGLGSLQFGNGGNSRRLQLRRPPQESRDLQETELQRGKFSAQLPITTFEESLGIQLKKPKEKGMSNAEAILLVTLSFILVVNSILIAWIWHSRKARRPSSAKDTNSTSIIDTDSSNHSSDYSKSNHKKRGGTPH